MSSYDPYYDPYFVRAAKRLHEFNNRNAIQHGGMLGASASDIQAATGTEEAPSLDDKAAVEWAMSHARWVDANVTTALGQASMIKKQRDWQAADDLNLIMQSWGRTDSTLKGGLEWGAAAFLDPVAYAAGAAGGGLVAKGLSRYMVTSLMRGATKGAAIGAGAGAMEGGIAGDVDVWVEDPIDREGTAESALVGTALGAVVGGTLGAAIPVVGAGIKAINEKIRKTGARNEDETKALRKVSADLQGIEALMNQMKNWSNNSAKKESPE